MPLAVTELVTDANFDAEAYIMANSDVASLVQRGGDAAKHYRLHGHKEKRRQINRQYMDARTRYLTEKFARFESVLNVRVEWTFGEEPGRFPIVIGTDHFTKSDYVAESLSCQYLPFLHEFTTNPDGLFMDLGCGLVDSLYDNVLYVEVYPSLTADVIVPADCDYPFVSEAFDGIGCFAVFEHVKYPWKVASEIKRMLKPGGMAFIDWPFLQPVHGYPSHYYNATRQGLELLFSDAGRIEFCRTEPSQDAAFTLTWILRKFLQELPLDKRKRVSALSIADLVRESPLDPFWREIMEGFPETGNADLACGNTLCFTKDGGSGAPGESPTGALPRSLYAPRADPGPRLAIPSRASLWDRFRRLVGLRS